jgi:hypothetical protein
LITPAIIHDRFMASAIPALRHRDRMNGSKYIPTRCSVQSGMSVANVGLWPILLQKSAILVVGLPLRPLEADSDYSFSHWTLVGV